MGEDSKKMGRWTKIGIGIAAFFLLYTVFGFFIAPPLLKSILTKRLTEHLHREVSMERIQMNPYSLTVRVSGFSVNHREQPGVFVSFDEFYANLQAVSVIKRALVLSEFRLAAPYLNLARTGDHSFNVSDLWEDKETPEPPPGGPAKPLLFSVANIAVTGGRIDFSDEPKQTNHRIADLTLGLPFVSNFPYHAETRVQPHFSAMVNETPVSFQGKTLPFHQSLETALNIDIESLDLTHYLAYAPFELPCRVVSGFLDVDTELAYVQTAEHVASLYVSGSVLLRNFKATEASGELLNEIPRLEVSLGRSDLLAGKVHIETLVVSSPHVNAVRNAAGAFNLARLTVVTGDGEPKQEDSEPGGILIVDEIRVSDGRIDIRDETVDGPFTATLSKVDVNVSGFTNDAGKQARVALSLLTDAGEDLILDGAFSVNPLSAHGNVRVNKVPLKRYAPYYRNQVLFRIEAGDLDLRTDYGFIGKDEQADPQIRLSGLSTRLNGLRLSRENEKEAFFEAPVISVSDTSVDVTGRRVTVGNFSTEKGHVNVIRSAEGVINLTELVPGGEPVQEDRSGNPWEFLLKEGNVTGFNVLFQDAVPVAPVTLAVTGIDLKLENIATTEDSTGNLSLTMNLPGKGRLALAGRMGISPPIADLEVRVAGLDVRPYQPYWKDKITLTVTGASVSTQGNAVFHMPADKDARGGFKGKLQVTDFRVIDSAHAQDFLKWKSLRVDGIDVSLNPPRVHIEGVTLSDFYSRIAIDENGRANLQDIVVAPKADAATPSEPAEAQGRPEKEPALNIDVRTVRLEGGKIDYSDRFIRPHVDAELSGLEGAVTGLTSEDAQHADVHITGKTNQHAPLEITGKVNPLGRDLFLDLKVRTTGIDLSPATPYAGKYMGYTIEKGKLSLQLDYRVAQRTLQAENRVFLDQFTLGQTVESAHATKLPVALAVSLLKNRAGEINLDLPVSGSLDDPEFKVGKVILQIIVNLLKKVLTAPFALLGALVGGGEELSYVEFEPGSSELDETGRAKLGKLVDVLYDRPGLRIELAGYADPAADREALKQEAFMRKLRQHKMDVLMAMGEAVKSLDDIVIEPEEYDIYLEMAYQLEIGPLPEREPADKAEEEGQEEASERDGSLPEADAAEAMTTETMKEAIMEHIQVMDDQLRLLALKRSERIRDFLISSEKVEPGRVFMSEPKSLTPEKKENQKDSRVEFILK